MRKICLLAPLLLLLPLVSGQLRTSTTTHYNDEKTWKEAQDYCRKHHIDLVTMTDRMVLEDEIQGWIGLYWSQSTSDWRWSSGDEKATYLNLSTVSEASHNGQEYCAFKKKGVKEWYKQECDEKHTFTCYDENLVLVKEPKTWEEALDHCRALRALDPSRPATDYQNHRYDLATLLTEDDRAFAREKAGDVFLGAVWTGRRFLAGRWLWVGGEKGQYPDDDSCPTSKLCGVVQLDESKTPHARKCDMRLHFLCNKKTRNKQILFSNTVFV